MSVPLTQALGHTNMAIPIPFDDRIDRAGHLAVLARRFFDVWWYCEGSDTRPQILDAMNEFPEFFLFDSHAHLVALITHLAGLFESRKDTVNFEALISEAESSDLVTPDTLAKAKVILGSVSALRPKVAILRSNVFSHRSASLSYENAFTLAAVTPYQLRDMVAAGMEIANVLLAARRLPEAFYSGSTLEHLKGLLQVLADRARG